MKRNKLPSRQMREALLSFLMLSKKRTGTHCSGSAPEIFRPASIDGRAGLLDDLRPLRGFSADEGAELFRRFARRIGTEIGHALIHVGRTHDSRKFGMHSRDDCR